MRARSLDDDDDEGEVEIEKTSAKSWRNVSKIKLRSGMHKIEGMSAMGTNVEVDIGVDKIYRGLMRAVEDKRRATIMFSKKSRAFLKVQNEGCCKRSGEDVLCDVWV